MVDPYQTLANAIIIQAIKDYRKALRQLERNSKYEPALSRKRECERFFRSEWFQVLSCVEVDNIKGHIARAKI